MEFLILAVITFFVIGPERMPIYARQAREWIKTLRRMAFDAKDEFKDALGDTGMQDINWRQYDPRQYDPRVIVKQAFDEDDAERAREAEEAERKAKEEAERAARRKLPAGAYAPFDSEAT
ncbi:MAG: Sec-independent protein translocase TatB [Rothia sp. (in: high G+C Gram-positive bacteria)]|uniref:Sec-independent protein translocase TatB n=1 Tax=Rothia sp. (in: high G+C Gram-positive bacteria) TaxID=1885016 RepID=UPI0026E0C25F|nr:Sec-independent protein translocase TatB [Rothia sp. (in: high G+C Gram-positive bacteria)]MDO5750094.1 Sec-independent protein translocase TatB [Rothia sp. (in: high G+C Gram-positive bacteria)]